MRKAFSLLAALALSACAFNPTAMSDARRALGTTIVEIIRDPVYLTEPFLRTTDFEYDARQEIAPYPCEAVTEVVRPKGTVPSHLPGENRFLAEFPAQYGLPAEAARGGAETMYPEYRTKLKTLRPAAKSTTTTASK